MNDNENLNMYKVPVVYQMMGYVEVFAESSEAAFKQVSENINSFSLPENAEYLEDSFEVDEDGAAIEVLYR